MTEKLCIVKSINKYFSTISRWPIDGNGHFSSSSNNSQSLADAEHTQRKPEWRNGARMYKTVLNWVRFTCTWACTYVAAYCDIKECSHNFCPAKSAKEAASRSSFVILCLLHRALRISCSFFLFAALRSDGQCEQQQQGKNTRPKWTESSECAANINKLENSIWATTYLLNQPHCTLLGAHNSMHIVRKLEFSNDFKVLRWRFVWDQCFFSLFLRFVFTIWAYAIMDFHIPNLAQEHSQVDGLNVFKCCSR